MAALCMKEDGATYFQICYTRACEVASEIVFRNPGFLMGFKT
ncbi:hypothetical protein NC653_012369 [Populus alba x Populus x berolinensis]|uniref:Uncharacterized protein n=1 Tax=Populus alba x Populus x berolinensis TaxID=444605 RepID=A0AAD6R4Y8_9ROSI|nr:hypothetical protein NC653_012369 [Populus alba x Populus x berolinensis]